MAIHRGKRPQRAYTPIRNDVLRDDRLSYRARGILAVILSHSEGWTTSAEDLARTGKEGRDAIRAAKAELEMAGYLVREKHQDARGRWTTQEVVYDEPQDPAQTGANPDEDALFATDDGFPGVGKPAVGSPAVGFPGPIQNTNQKGSLPSGEKAPADIVATAAYEALDKMGNYMALRQVAGKALRAGHQVAEVEAAVLRLIHDGKPVTGQTLWTALNGSAQGGTIRRDANHDHWQAGGTFGAPQEGGTP